MSEQESGKPKAVKGFSPGDSRPDQDPLPPKSPSSILALVTIGVLAVLILGLSYLFLTWQPEPKRTAVETVRRSVPVKPAPEIEPAPVKEQAAAKPQESPQEPSVEKTVAEAGPGARSDLAPAEEPTADKAPERSEETPGPEAVEPAEVQVAKSEPPAAAEEVPKAEPPVVAISGPVFRIQVGAFLGKANLEKVKGALEQLGYETSVQTLESDVEVTRLKVRNVNSEDLAAELERLKKAVPDAFILRENGAGALYAGSFSSSARAAALAERLETVGIRTQPVKATVKLPMYKLRAGRYDSKRSADTALKALGAAGFEGFVVGPL